MNDEEWLFKKFQKLPDAGQLTFLDRILSKANREQLKQKREDISKTVLLNHYSEEAKILTDNWGTQLGLLSQYETLNEYCGGFRRKGIYIIGGEASSGKSTFALNLALQFDQQNKKVHIVSYEDPSVFVAARISIMLGGLDNTKITVPAPELIEGMYSMEHNRLYEHLAKIKEKHGLDVVVIDYIQFMALFAEEMEYIAINNTMKLFRDLAKSLDCVVIGLSQLNRGKETDKNRFHGSSAIEKLADVAVIINKDKDYPNSFTVQVVKSKYTQLRDQRIKFKFEKGKEGALLLENGTMPIGDKS